jgi:hypothetical protein
MGYVWTGRASESPPPTPAWPPPYALLAPQAIVSRVPELPTAKAWAERVRGLHITWGGAAMAQRDEDITPVMYAASVLPRVWLRG